MVAMNPAYLRDLGLDVVGTFLLDSTASYEQLKSTLNRYDTTSSPPNDTLIHLGETAPGRQSPPLGECLQAIHKQIAMIQEHMQNCFDSDEREQMDKAVAECFQDLENHASVARASEAMSVVSACEEALASALTKFDSLRIYFASGCSFQSVCSMLLDEILQDKDFVPLTGDPEYLKEIRAQVKRVVGKALGEWKKAGSVAETGKLPGKLRDNPLPWPSIDAYPEWVVGQVEIYVHAAPEEKSSARRHLEETLLEKQLLAASIKYDGTCFGKLDNGDLVGRRQLLGKGSTEYQQTSTAATEACDVAALRRSLSQMLAETGVQLGPVCVWGELMCNPGFYSYKERGLASKWICFGVVVALADSEGGTCETDCRATQLQQLSQELARQGLAHSLSSNGFRLLLCPALRRLLRNVAGCDVVEEHFQFSPWNFQGLTHAELVAQAAAGLRAGENEGLVLAFERPGGHASLRKWKNSAEGGSVSKKHAELLRKCQGWCAGLVSSGSLDVRVAEMVETMQSVAEAKTSPAKRGRKAS